MYIGEAHFYLNGIDGQKTRMWTTKSFKIQRHVCILSYALLRCVYWIRKVTGRYFFFKTKIGKWAWCYRN